MPAVEPAELVSAACVASDATSSSRVPVRGRVLVVAYHFPPQKGSSGFLRTLKFCRYLPEFGWLPTVLTIRPGAYEQVDECQLGEIPVEVKVVRAFGLDARRHLSLGRRYLRACALPDRWASWLPGAVAAGLYNIAARHIEVIFTTFPIASAVAIGYVLHMLTGKPWFVDFRDTMTEPDYPKDPLTRRIYQWIERRAVRHGSRFVFTAPSAVRMYLARYPRLPAEQCLWLPNGYDEPDFAALESTTQPSDSRIRLLHSGVIYPWERDPGALFGALARLKAAGYISAETLAVDLRASGADSEFQQQVATLGIGDIVHLLPPLPYRAALQDAARAHGLLLLQGACCDHQIPAKAYEYLRLNKPILALSTATGDTARLLTEVGGATMVDLANEDAICAALPNFLQRVREGTHPVPSPAVYRKYSRRDQAHRLADCMDEVKAGARHG